MKELLRVEVKSPRSKRRQLYRSLLHDDEPDFGHEEHPGWTKEVGKVSSKLDEKKVMEEEEGSKGSKCLTNAAQRDECLCHGSLALSLVSNADRPLGLLAVPVLHLVSSSREDFSCTWS